MTLTKELSMVGGKTFTARLYTACWYFSFAEIWRHDLFEIVLHAVDVFLWL